MIRLLLITLLGFLFLSSSAAAFLGIQQIRVVLFSLVFLSLLGAAILQVPKFDSRGLGLPMALLVGLLWLIALDGSHNILDYKIALPVVGLLIAPNLRRAIAHIPLLPTFLSLLGVYVVATSASFIFGADNVTARGYDAFIRYDLTGSIVTHASLCTIALLVSSVLAVHSSGARRYLAMLLAVLAAAMILITAARTALLTILIFAAISIVAGPNRKRQLQAICAGFAASVLVFACYSIFVSDAFLLRLTANDGVDFSSGRLHSAEFWLAIAAERPFFGHGLGTVRALLAEGRPIIDGGRYLEWPHNEFLRMFVEGGLFGLAFMAIFVAGILAKAVKYAPEAPPEARALTLMIAADMLAQCLFQNYFNTIYHSTVLLTVFAMLTAPGESTRLPARHTSFAMQRRSSAGASIGNM